MDKLKTAAQAALSIIVGYWRMIPALTQTLVFIMALDILLGVIIAIKQRQLSAAVAYTGITKKVGALVMIGVAALLNPHVQPAMGIDLVQAASFFYLAYEVASIVRNAAILEVPVFSQMQDVLRYFSQSEQVGKKS